MRLNVATPAGAVRDGRTLSRKTAVVAHAIPHALAHAIPHPMAIGDHLSIAEDIGTTITTVTYRWR
jgi:hypothetical protein